MTDQDKSALLSKLRAEGVQAQIKRYYHGTDHMQETASGDWVRYDDHVAALASAPVAREATDDDIRRIATLPECHHGGDFAHAVDPIPFARALLARYAAPQASEAVRNAALEEAAQALDRLHEENRRWHNEFRGAAAVVRALKPRAALSAQPGAQKQGEHDA
jgi:hypothetical protein